MTTAMLTRLAVSLLALVAIAPDVAAQHARAPWSAIAADAVKLAPAKIPALQSNERGKMPRWVKWGLVGAAVGAITMPMLSGLSPDTEKKSPATYALGGALAGFVIIGGAVALYDSVCGPNSPPRPPGFCGR